MKHRFRFFGEKRSDTRWSIDELDQSHLNRVLKLKLGTEIEVGNGRGQWAVGELAKEGDVAVLLVKEEFSAPSPKPLVLLLGALKHGEFDELIAPLTEVGVTHCRLFLQPGCEKSRLAAKAQRRWQQLRLAAMKQSKAPHLMELQIFKTLQEAAENLPVGAATAKYCLAPGRSSLLQVAGLTEGMALAIGSEKGFDETEWEWLRANDYLPASIGANILRAKTAAVLAGGLGALILTNSN